MFTGLIEGTGTLLKLERHGPDARMTLQANYPLQDLVLGESISVDGACLTVVSFHGRAFTVDISTETLARTTLGRKPPGSRLNLERALRMGDRLGGHLVSGHVDGLGTLKDRMGKGRSVQLTFQISPDLARYTIEKGSVAVNGISLTINGCRESEFDVNIVPHTAGETTISELQVGDAVNIETDLVGKYIEKMVKTWKMTGEKSKTSDQVDYSFLQKHGFV